MIKINDKPILTKEEILQTGEWVPADYINAMEGYFWKDKTLLEDGYYFYMRRYINDGFTTVHEEGRNRDGLPSKLFEGYIKTANDLEQMVHLLRLREI